MSWFTIRDLYELGSNLPLFRFFHDSTSDIFINDHTPVVDSSLVLWWWFIGVDDWWSTTSFVALQVKTVKSHIWCDYNMHDGFQISNGTFLVNTRWLCGEQTHINDVTADQMRTRLFTFQCVFLGLSFFIFYNLCPTLLAIPVFSQYTYAVRFLGALFRSEDQRRRKGMV